MPRERTGSVIKRKSRKKGERPTWWARVTFVDEVTRKRHDLQRRAESKAHAQELMHKLVAEHDNNKGRTLLNESKTFNDWAAHFEANYLKEAQYAEGRKISGRRSLRGLDAQLNAMRAYFGRRRLSSITYGDLANFRTERLSAPTPADIARHKVELRDDANAELRSTRTIATVNRELALLRRMLNVAQRDGWIKRNPFDFGEPLIAAADEKQRQRILTREEEMRLLAACDARTITYTCRGKQVTAHDTGKRREHLKPILICALDTGMRNGEILSLRWRDVAFDSGIITIQAFNTKTMRERQVSMTVRLTKELERLWQASPKDLNGRVFGITDNVSGSFQSVRRAAGLSDLRFHDLRHTAASRLVGLHIPLSEVGRVLGHTQPQTTFRYVNANIETVRRASAALDTFHGEAREHVEANEMVN